MAQRLIEATEDPLSGTYLYKYEEVSALLRRSEAEGKPTLLIGVTFALLDLAERFRNRSRTPSSWKRAV